MADHQINVSDGFDNPRSLIELKDDGATNAGGETLRSVAVHSYLSATDNAVLDDIAENQTDGTQIAGVKFFDENDSTYKGMLFHEGAPQVCSQDYLLAISEGDISGHTSFAKVGYSPTITTVESDVWGAAGSYTFPASAIQMEVASSDNTVDIGTSIFDGTSTGGSTTTLIDTGKDFTAGTAVAVGDCILLDKSGTTPEWGYVTGVAATTLTVAGGFSDGGTGSGRAYYVIDKSAHAGAQVVLVQYLNASHAVKTELVILNGTTPVDTVGTALYRIQNLGVIAAGTNNKPTGAITIKDTGAAVTYGYITAGYNASRSTVFTVPNNKTLYITSITLSWGYAANQTHYARLYLRGTMAQGREFNTGSIFFPYAEAVCANSAVQLELRSPIKFIAKTDIKVSGIASAAGVATVVMRGWIE